MAQLPARRTLYQPPSPSGLVIRGGWWGRMWAPVLRLMGVLRSTHPEPHDAGTSFLHGQMGGVSPSFSVSASMSAMAQFGWVAACVNAIATDIGSRPLQVVRGPEGAEERVDNHPVLDLIAQPASRTLGHERRLREIVHWVLCGNAYTRILRLGDEGDPVGLLPLFPELTSIEPWPDGQVGRFLYAGARGEVPYSYDEVLHVKRTSWESDARALYGTGTIGALHKALLSYQAFENMTVASTQLGRITGVFSQQKGDQRLSMGQMARVREFYHQQLASGDDALFIPEGLAFQRVTPTARDMEGSENQTRVIEQICAVFGVPPVRIMLRGAKFSEAGHQMRLYWEGLRDSVAPLNDQYTRLVRMFPGSEGLRVKHDFSSVRYLQQHRKERLDMVKVWVELGLSLPEAAAYEGFIGLPKPVRPPALGGASQDADGQPSTGERETDGDRDPEADDDQGRTVPAPLKVAAGAPDQAGRTWGWLTVHQGGQPAAPDDGESDVD